MLPSPTAEATRFTGLNLTSRQLAMKGGKSGPAISDLNPEKRPLFIMAASRKMPPGMPLSGGEIDELRRWVASGAAWPSMESHKAEPKRAGLDWWSLQPVGKPALPKTRYDHLSSNPVDRFLFAKLEAKGLRPGPPASRLALLRRVTFDLTGLPPTPAEVRAFLADDSAEAYAKVMDRLLAVLEEE